MASLSIFYFAEVDQKSHEKQISKIYFDSHIQKAFLNRYINGIIKHFPLTKNILA